MIKVIINRKMTLGEKLPVISPQQEIKVLEYLIRQLELEENYETCEIAYRRIQSLKQQSQPLK
ncbi:MAG: hypothetical protein ACLQQ4_08330 [Bacteroidia bacterium]